MTEGAPDGEPVPAAATAWATSIAAYVFDPPGEDTYVSPIVRADHGPLHLEVRYNYEELDTGSFFVGGNVSFGEIVSVGVTPMFGVVLGSIDGFAPGAELELEWKGLAWYVETEYVVDLGEDSDDFLYTWSELTFAPLDGFRFGLVSQRTRVFHEELEVDRGLLLGFSGSRLWLDLYLFNPDVDDPYAGGSVGVGF